MTINYNEKRDFYRMKVDCEINYKIEGGVESFLGKGSDLSADGVLFTSSHYIEKGTNLELHIKPYIETIQPLTAKATVVRCERFTDGYIVAVKMVNVN